MNRRKKSKIMLGLLLAVIGLGIGYAAIAGVNLLVNGNATVKSSDANFNVRFVKNDANETAIENPTENAIRVVGHNADETLMDVSGMSASVEDDTHATFAAGALDEVGEYVEFTYTVVNESDRMDAALTFDVEGENDAEDYFEITKTVSKEQIAKQETATVTVKVKLIDTPKLNDYDATFSVTLNTTPEEPSESGGGSSGVTQLENNPIGPYAVAPTAEDTHKGIVYLDPTDLSKDCNEESSVSLTGTKTGCMKWYVIADNGDSVDIFLDHNASGLLAYDTSGTYKEYANASIKSTVDALVSSDGWKVTPRLITAEEIVAITENTEWINAKTQNFVFGSKSGTLYNYMNDEQKARHRSFKWLFEYTNCGNSGCSNIDNNTYGYWTSSPVSDDSTRAWSVASTGMLTSWVVSNDSTFGIRPVITVPKSIF